MLTLAVETCTARYGVALGRGRHVLFDSLRDLGAEAGRDLGDLVRRGLARLDASAADIGAIAVDIGPGSLGSLRDGVAFAHGLAYARALPLYAFTSFELVGHAAGASAARPALCTRRANEGLAYAGVFDGARILAMRHGPLGDIVPALAVGGRAFVAAGSFRAETPALAPHADVVVSAVETPSAATMLALGLDGRSAHDALATPALPLTESAEIFRA